MGIKIKYTTFFLIRKCAICYKIILGKGHQTVGRRKKNGWRCHLKATNLCHLKAIITEDFVQEQVEDGIFLLKRLLCWSTFQTQKHLICQKQTFTLKYRWSPVNSLWIAMVNLLNDEMFKLQIYCWDNCQQCQIIINLSSCVLAMSFT